ncbi:hypothetical protein QQF64_026410 [Cirrhinus molitorella]|uniref:Uncharacterized protein n=2 Tax=Cirrhinus molitorella TaxID=172907 RepID=A0ABR3N9E5_9TELE|nr:hypothetical protein Q8A67_002976 [Cirrhinus molitorella]
MATDIDRLVSFEEAHYDEYEYYNLEEYSLKLNEGEPRALPPEENALRFRPHILEMDERNRIVVQMSVLPFSLTH